MARKHPEINAAIRAAFEESGLSKPEVARQLYGDGERWREFDRYLKTTTPGASVAIELARIFDKPVGAFIPIDPLQALAQEVAELESGTRPGFDLEGSIRRVLVDVLHEVQFPRLNDLASRLDDIERRQVEGGAYIERSLDALDARLGQLEQGQSTGAGES